MLAKDGTCIEIPEPGCIETNKNGICTICSDNILVNQGKCNSSNKCSTNNCEICAREERTGKELCALCESSYALDYTKSDPCIYGNDQTQNCQLLDLTNNKCSICRLGYYIDKGICYKRKGMMIFKVLATIYSMMILFF